MKIALLHYSAPPIVGGVESVIAHHARLMTASGHQVTIFCGRGETFDPAIPVRVIPLLDSRNSEVMKVKAVLDTGAVEEAFSALREKLQHNLMEALNGFDVLIAHNVASLHKNLALTAALYTTYRLPGFPRLILWHHDLAWTAQRYRKELYPGYPWDLLREPWPGVINVVISRIRQRELAQLTGLSEDEILVIPNGVDLDSFYKFEERTVDLIKRTGLLEADPLLLAPVRLTPRKNIELALGILAALKSYYPCAKLLVTGPEGPHNPANSAYRDKLFALRDTLQLQGSAIFIAEVTPDFLPDEVISDFYRLSDALLLPSHEEGFGIPLLEAGFSKMPVFCADIPVLRELGGDDLDYFDPKGDPLVIARQVYSRLEAESTLRWSRKVKLHYTWQSVNNLYIEPLLNEEVK